MNRKSALRAGIALILTTAIAAFAASCAGNSRRAEEKMLELRAELLASESLTATADIRADYGERVFDFKIKYTGGAELGEIAILEPESLAGVTARVEDGGASLRYDGAALDTGPLGDGLSPAGILPTLISEWKTGFVDMVREEKLGGRAALAMTSALTDRTSQTTWFDEITGLPIRAEAESDGRTALIVEFENVAYR
ncbi:MAG: hypothetical protein LBC28_02400 [Oscillospiraceae bacterium]|nr:hypothetical protein [Oscillospiraceae bacterium]